jgi:para-nitrobenzyl esterase
MTRKLFAGLFMLAFCSIAMAAIPLPVKTHGGMVAGVAGKDASITVFRGIPFAAPPVGDMRWRAPQPAASWQGVKKADKFGASCIQSVVEERKPWTYEFMTHGDVSEDCLYLNVWTAAKSASEKRPVYVYIYGGGLNEGSGMVPAYDGEGLASKGLVVVNMNYRVGIFGFFSHPDLTKESEHHASGNYGLLDQLAALQWVHDNIAAFGGDPSRVTIAGQSAGATSVHALTASPLAKGLFQRAIAESGSAITGVGLMNSRPNADQEQDGVRFAELKGVTGIAALRALTWQDLMARGGNANGRTAPRFGMTVDGYFLPATVDQAFAEGKENDVPTLTGWNADESGASPNPTVALAAYQQQAKQRYGEKADLFLKLYPAGSDAEAAQMQNAAARDQSRTSMYLWAENRAKTAKTKAYTYFFNHPLPGPDVAKYGAFHTSEVPYTLNTLNMSDRPFTDQDRKVAAEISSYWVNFATTGDPNGKGLPHWPSVSEKPGTTMQIGDNPGEIAIAGDAAKTDFWKAYLTRPR